MRIAALSSPRRWAATASSNIFSGLGAWARRAHTPAASRTTTRINFRIAGPQLGRFLRYVESKPRHAKPSPDRRACARAFDVRLRAGLLERHFRRPVAAGGSPVG